MHNTAVIIVFLSALSLVACSSGSSVETPNNADSGGTDSGVTDDGVTTAGESTDGTATTGETTDGSTTAGGEQASGATSATYRLTFNASWSAQTHPTQFPGNAHFSGLVGAVHNNQINFWERGQIATDGVEVMAESGAKSDMLTELNAAIADGKALQVIDGGGVAESPGTISIEFTVSTDYPLLTLASMLAPSPDWFIGLNSLSMQLTDGTFTDRMLIDLALYDAGTDSGLSYSSGNLDTQPREPITRLTTEPQDAPFVDGMPSVGQILIEKIQ